MTNKKVNREYLEDARARAVGAVIRDFPFWDYGLDVVDPRSPDAEWVPHLAVLIVKALESREYE